MKNLKTIALTSLFLCGGLHAASGYSVPDGQAQRVVAAKQAIDKLVDVVIGSYDAIAMVIRNAAQIDAPEFDQAVFNKWEKELDSLLDAYEKEYNVKRPSGVCEVLGCVCLAEKIASQIFDKGLKVIMGNRVTGSDVQERFEQITLTVNGRELSNCLEYFFKRFNNVAPVGHDLRKPIAKYEKEFIEETPFVTKKVVTE
jgi:hypothetical protein